MKIDNKIYINGVINIQDEDAVFCKVDGYYLTHLVWLKSNGYCLIGSSHGGLNGWTNEVYAIATKTNKIRGIDDI